MRIRMWGGRRVARQALADLLRDLGLLLGAGAALGEALGLLTVDGETPGLGRLVRSLRREVSAGATLSAAMRENAGHFDGFLVELLERAEQQDRLPAALEEAADFLDSIALERSDDARWQRILFYPAAVIVVALVVTSILMIFVIPQFTALYRDFDAELPGMTLLLIEISQLFVDYWPLVLTIVALLAYALSPHGRRRPVVQRIGAQIAWWVPGVRRTWWLPDAVRFLRTFVFVSKRGASPASALIAASQTVDNAAARDALRRAAREVEQGATLAAALRRRRWVPRQVVAAAAVGERSGRLDDVLARVGNRFEHAIGKSLSQSEQLLEAPLTALIGVIIGFILVAVYLPLFKMGQVI